MTRTAIPAWGLVVLAACASPERVAFEACTNQLQDSLLAPSTAILPSPDEAEFDRFGSSGDSIEVRSHVDAENAFGAMVRTRWTCWVTGDSVVQLFSALPGEAPYTIAERDAWEAGRADREREIREIRALIDSLEDSVGERSSR